MSLPQDSIEARMLDLVLADTTNFSTLVGYIEGIPDKIPLQYRKACICLALLAEQRGATQQTGYDVREFYGEARFTVIAQQVLTFNATGRSIMTAQRQCRNYVEAFVQLFLRTANMTLDSLTYTNGIIEYVRFLDTITYVPDRMEETPIYTGIVPFNVSVKEIRT